MPNKLTPKQKILASKAAPKNKITGADFAKITKNKNMNTSKKTKSPVKVEMPIRKAKYGGMMNKKKAK
tara:strand:- start:1344 stop:1547 length:204 start_codon:yes stop_codon:yes gene_type:complete